MHAPLYTSRDFKKFRFYEVQDMTQGPADAHAYTCKFAVTSFIEAIDTWLKKKLVESLMKSPFFSIVAKKCEGVGAQEDLNMLPMG